MKKIFYMFLGFILCLVVLGIALFCIRVQKDPVTNDIEIIRNVADIFEDQLADLGINKETVDSAIEKIEELNKKTKYIIEFDIQNDTNPILGTTLHLPVEEEF